MGIKVGRESKEEEKAEGLGEEENNQQYTNTDNSENNNNNYPPYYYPSAGGGNRENQDIEDIEELDISQQRKYFLEGSKHFKDNSYLLEEYYFNKIKDDYLILQDHVIYYLAKSLLLQDKFDLAENYYSKLVSDFPDSIWAEKSNLEYSDLFYLKENYIRAEQEYNNFILKFPDSDYLPYCVFQMATCQERNGKYDKAYQNYKKIWLNIPKTSMQK